MMGEIRLRSVVHIYENEGGKAITMSGLDFSVHCCFPLHLHLASADSTFFDAVIGNNGKLK